MTDLLPLLLGAALINHLVLGLPRATDDRRATRLRALGPVSALLILLAIPLGWGLAKILGAWALDALRLIALPPLAAALVWLAQRLCALLRPAWHRTDLWPLLLANGMASLMLGGQAPNLATLPFVALLGATGFWLLLHLLDDLLERIERGNVPAAFRGAPLLLIATGLMGMALLGLAGVGQS